MTLTHVVTTAPEERHSTRISPNVNPPNCKDLCSELVGLYANPMADDVTIPRPESTRSHQPCYRLPAACNCPRLTRCLLGRKKHAARLGPITLGPLHLCVQGTDAGQARDLAVRKMPSNPDLRAERFLRFVGRCNSWPLA